MNYCSNLAAMQADEVQEQPSAARGDQAKRQDTHRLLPQVLGRQASLQSSQT
jgi:hypothetical protein